MFSYGIDRKTLLTIFGVVALLSILSGGMDAILNKILLLPGILIALTFHEYAHAYTAVKLGDETPRLQGRLNLNPITHIDPMGFIFLLLAGFGWGKPVEIDSRNFNSKYTVSQAEAIVSVAGPIANFILAFIFLIIYYAVFIVTDITAGLSTQVAGILEIMVIYTVSINIGLGVFNLIPLPPLDGSKILMHFLSYNAKQWFYNNIQIFYMVFLVIWITGLSSTLIEPIFNAVLTGMDWVVSSIFGLFI